MGLGIYTSNNPVYVCHCYETSGVFSFMRKKSITREIITVVTFVVTAIQND